jgi:hypothetical protein
MARIRIIALSLMLLYSSVAQVLAVCRTQNQHGQFTSAAAHSHHADSEEQSRRTAKWHCGSCDLHVGSALPRIRPVLLEEITVAWGNPDGFVKVTQLLSELSITSPNRSPSISVPVNSSRFLPFLSVFRI